MDSNSPAAAVPHTRRPPRFIGDASAVLLAGLAGGVLGGITWAMARPMQKVTFLDDGRLVVAQDGVDATFSALLWFVGIALVLGLALGSFAHRRFPTARGLAMEAWSGVAALAMSAVQLVAGNMIAGVRQPDLDGVAPGTSLDVLPAFDVPVALLVAPFAAMLAYWCLLFLAPGAEPSDGPAEQPEPGGTEPGEATPGEQAAGQSAERRTGQPGPGESGPDGDAGTVRATG
ncbi:hypothetical protein ACFORJ_05695 [Corynebacterium hansenii]|uniref:DUF2567 domain-containing protein n=1 Tax=Corynebacterium hansenii TaxID=394964 RepID=A0ABV7ZN26_9CORY|nr:hypothetical protein [Corynebacterium hansenii]WJZ00236.1 hypothetical protein CHAN_08135 [Corynebacterium hansenii]